MTKANKKFIVPNGLREATSLTKREYFAGLAMQGMIRDIRRPETPCIAVVTELSIGFADALLAALEGESDE